MPKLRRFLQWFQQYFRVSVDHRAKAFGGPHGFDARERGRRHVTMRPLEPRDFNRSIKEEWIRAVNDKAEETINKIMQEKSFSKDKAAEWLKTGRRSVEKKFQQGNIHFVLRYDFLDGNFYWSSTRRVSDSDERRKGI